VSRRTRGVSAVEQVGGSAAEARAAMSDFRESGAPDRVRLEA
jgi:hypothetical protein